MSNEYSNIKQIEREQHHLKSEIMYGNREIKKYKNNFLKDLENTGNVIEYVEENNKKKKGFFYKLLRIFK